MVTRPALPLAVAALLGTLCTNTAHAAQSSSLERALPAHATGEQIFVAACATCHGIDGKGSPSAVVGFDLPLPNGHSFPDFTDCATNTVEPLGDWMAVALPTGYPSRRLWLHVTVRNEQGEPVFESGAPSSTGAIGGNDNDRDAERFEPHYQEITSSDQVQIYESILGDVGGAVTTGLLSATQYLKDNRLLPRGFDKTTAPAEIGVFGGAKKDGDFTGGSDRVRYRIPVATPGALTIDVELRFQTVAYRWAQNLGRYDAPEPKRFVSYYAATADGSSVVIATDRVHVN